VSSSANGRAAYLRVKTHLACAETGVLRPGESGRHEVELDNRGPLAARFDVEGKCEGPLLQARGGSKSWTSTVSVPAALRDHKRKVTGEIQLPSLTDLGTSGCEEDIAVDVKRYRGKHGHEKALTLSLQVMLRP
jgi:hypothetical protein